MFKASLGQVSVQVSMQISMAVIAVSLIGCSGAKFQSGGDTGGVTSTQQTGQSVASAYESSTGSVGAATSSNGELCNCLALPSDPLAVADPAKLTDAEIVSAVEQNLQKTIKEIEDSIECLKNAQASAQIISMTQTLLDINKDLLSKLTNDSEFRKVTVQIVRQRGQMGGPLPPLAPLKCPAPDKQI